MKERGLALLIVLTVALASASPRAATAQTTQQSVANLITSAISMQPEQSHPREVQDWSRAIGGKVWRLRPVRRTFAPLAVVHGSARQTAEDFRLSPDEFTPATVVYQGQLDASHHLFGAIHPAGYSAVMTGYEEGAKDGDITYVYQGSMFPSADAAHAVFLDGVQYSGTFDPTAPRDCSDVFKQPCDITTYDNTSGGAVLYMVIQVNYCLVETGAYAPLAVFKANAAAIEKLQAHLAVDAFVRVQTMCAGSAPTSAAALQPLLSIVKVALGHSVKGQTKPTTTLRSREQGLFVAIYRVTNPGEATPSATLAFLRNGRPWSTGTVDMEARTAADGTTYVQAAQVFTAKKRPLHLQARFILTLGSSQDTRTLDFTVKPVCVKSKCS